MGDGKIIDDGLFVFNPRTEEAFAMGETEQSAAGLAAGIERAEAMKCIPGYYQRNYNMIPLTKFGDEVVSLRVIRERPSEPRARTRPCPRLTVL